MQPNQELKQLLQNLSRRCPKVTETNNAAKRMAFKMRTTQREREFHNKLNSLALSRLIILIGFHLRPPANQQPLNIGRLSIRACLVCIFMSGSVWGAHLGS